MVAALSALRGAAVGSWTALMPGRDVESDLEILRGQKETVTIEVDPKQMTEEQHAEWVQQKAAEAGVEYNPQTMVVRKIHQD